ncbi:arginine--tRNA ligase [Pseudactinotalea terrae]|uniref:arginine--tRNA ligase n=1 Tax=Pseudactinotalea terrae TaxID=1743262 RepID=UPI0012E2D19D
MTGVSAHVTPLAEQLSTALGHAIAASYPDHAGADPLIRPSDHADLQANAALALAKKVGTSPREVASAVVEQISENVLIGEVEISGPGFINLTLSDAALWSQVEARLADDRLGVPSTELGRRTVVDYSAPNIAKEMHVGHLRSTIIGDSLVRVLEFLGSQVIRQNHLGDWGTQFGMLITYIDEHPDEPWRHADLEGAADPASPVSALDELYKKARAEFDGDPGFAHRARRRVVALQAGDEDTLRVWKDIVTESEYAFDTIYARLGVQISSADSAGESTYNAVLASVAKEMADAGVAVESDGALVVLSEEIIGRDEQPAALIIRKSDGGYGYGTTDMATIRHRIKDLKADRILYVVGAPQAMHFKQVFEAARRMGWLTDQIEAVHVPFGSVLGSDGKMFKTRAGGTVRLAELLDQAVEAAENVVREGAEGRGEQVDEAELTRISEQAGIGAIKYADLSSNRVKDYVFDPERMVAFTGNTGVYLQYAHTRMASILRKATDRGLATPTMVPGAVAQGLEPAERALTLQLDAFGEVLVDVIDGYEPHKLATYLYETARAFTEFYEACPVLSAEGVVRDRRLALVDLTRRTVARALDLLGIAAPERM